MPAYLVTGRGGTGKSTICDLLKKTGHDAFDTDDITGLARAEDAKTQQPIEVDWSGYVDYSKVAWNWQASVLEAFLAAHAGHVFLCGSASNQADFYHFFDKVFVLNPDRETHQRHLQSRGSVYGKDPKMLTTLLDVQQGLARELINQGAIPIGVSGTVQQSVNDILEAAKL